MYCKEIWRLNLICAKASQITNLETEMFMRMENVNHANMWALSSSFNILPFSKFYRGKSLYFVIIQQVKRWRHRHKGQQKGHRDSPFLHFSRDRFLPLMNSYREEQDDMIDAYSRAKGELVKEWREQEDKQE